MNATEFKKYIESRKKLDTEFKNVKDLEKKYEKIKSAKEKYNQYHREYYKDMMDNNPSFKEKRREQNLINVKKFRNKKKTDLEKQVEPVKSVEESKPVEPVKPAIEEPERISESFFKLSLGI